MSDPLLRVEALRKVYGRTVVLDGLDLEVDAHDVVVLIGASGFPHLTVLDNVTLAPRKVHGVAPDIAAEKALVMLDRSGQAPDRYRSEATKAAISVPTWSLSGTHPVCGVRGWSSRPRDAPRRCRRESG